MLSSETMEPRRAIMSSKTIDIHDAKEHLEELLLLVDAGAEIVLTDADTPRARLVPLASARKRKAGLHPGSIEISEDFDEPLPDEFWLGG
jgi:antitoxin (DNA-binding transcriptional repressor) of toxin-antitoxin stability system